eukprot:7802993-Lingulodinium_polyedra.AAC.1
MATATALWTCCGSRRCSSRATAAPPGTQAGPGPRREPGAAGGGVTGLLLRRLTCRVRCGPQRASA